ncbi:hypothetical protein AAZX31_05G071400 [Glycine max]
MDVQVPLTDKEKLGRDLKRLNDKLAFTLSKCNAKDEQIKKQTKIVQEAVARWEKAEAKILSMKQHLDESIQLQLVYKERVAQLDGAIKECMQQLHFVREEQEQRIHDFVMKASKEFEEAHIVLEEQLSETNKWLAKSGRQLSHGETDHNALVIRLESIEKDNAFLKYEAQLLEKELAIRNEERELNCRAADASHKLHLQSRLLEMLAQDSFEMRRKNLNSTSIVVESSLDSFPKTTIRRITTLIDQLCESLNRKANEIQFLRVMLPHTTSKLMRLESNIESTGHVTLEQPKSNPALQDISLSSTTDIGSEDEQFRSVKQKESMSCKSVGPLDTSLMDDFLEMEKLAVVFVEKAPKISCASLEENNEIYGLPEARPNGISSEFSTSNQESCSIDILNGDIPGWLLDDSHDVVKVILEQNFVTHKNLDDIRKGIRLALSYLNNADQCELFIFSQQTSWKPLNNSVVDPCGEVNDAEILSIKGTKQQPQRDLSQSIDSLYKRDGNIHTHKNQGMPTGYMVCIFQWKTSELRNVLQQFLHVCYDLLNDKADHEKFTTELTTTLDWIMNHCFSLQDTISENEVETGMFADTDKLYLPIEQLSCLSKTIGSLRLELQTLKELNRIIEEQLTDTELKEANHKVLALEVELENKNQYCEELETRCIELQLQLESMTKQWSDNDVNQRDEPLQTISSSHNIQRICTSHEPTELEANRKPESQTNLGFTMSTVDKDSARLQSRNSTSTTRSGSKNTYHGRFISTTVILDPSLFASFEDGVCKHRLRFERPYYRNVIGSLYYDAPNGPMS